MLSGVSGMSWCVGIGPLCKRQCSGRRCKIETTGTALFGGAEYVTQLGLFWLAPVAGAMIAGALSRPLYDPDTVANTIVIGERSAAAAD